MKTKNIIFSQNIQKLFIEITTNLFFCDIQWFLDALVDCSNTWSC